MKCFKVTLCALLAASMLVTLAACGQAKKEETNASENNTTAEQDTEDTVDTVDTVDTENTVNDEEEGETQADISAFAGTYPMSYDGSELIIREDGSAEVTLVDLAYMQGEVTGVSKSIVALTVQDPSGNEMGLEFDYETHELFVVDSTWDLLENGMSYQFD